MVIVKFPEATNIVCDEDEWLVEFILGLNYFKFEIHNDWCVAYYSQVGESIKFSHPLYFPSSSLARSVGELIWLRVVRWFCVDTY